MLDWHFDYAHVTWQVSSRFAKFTIHVLLYPPRKEEEPRISVSRTFISFADLCEGTEESSQPTTGYRLARNFLSSSSLIYREKKSTRVKLMYVRSLPYFRREVLRTCAARNNDQVHRDAKKCSAHAFTHYALACIGQHRDREFFSETPCFLQEHLHARVNS